MLVQLQNQEGRPVGLPIVVDGLVPEQPIIWGESLYIFQSNDWSNKNAIPGQLAIYKQTVAFDIGPVKDKKK